MNLLLSLYLAVLFATGGATAFTNPKFPATTNHSVCAWILEPSFPSPGQAIIFFRDSGVTGNSEQIANATNTGVVGLFTAAVTTTIATFTANTWRYVCWSISGVGAGGVQAYTSPAGGGTLVNTSGLGTGIPTSYDTSFIGKDLSGDNFVGRLACVIMWDRVITQSEAQSQEFHCRPQIWTSIDFWLPMYNSGNGVVDFSGRGNSVTAGGTAVTTADGPPVVQ